jgi:hypothetical protein
LFDRIFCGKPVPTFPENAPLIWEFRQRQARSAIDKRHSNQGLAHARLLPKFVPEVLHELWQRAPATSRGS